MANIPRLDARWFAGMCALGPRPLVVTGWLKVWLQGHYASAANIEDSTSQALTNNLWRPDSKTSLRNMVIESVTQWKPEMTEHRPAIMIKCNGWKRIRVGINDRMIGTISPDGNERYANFWQGSHTLFCISGDGAETWKLAAETFRELNEFGPVVRIILDLMRLEVAEVGELYKIETNGRENFIVPITIAYAYEENWKVIEEAPMIRTLNLANFQP